MRRAAFTTLAASAAALPLVLATSARAEPSATSAAAPSQGVAVVGGPGARDDAFVLARAVYATHLRPRRLDEPRARVLAGDAPGDGATADRRELAELRAAVVSEDAASRTVLGSIAQRVGASALLVVTRAPAPAVQEGSADAGSAPTGTSVQGPVVARLYLADAGEIDAARYVPDPDQPGAAAWRSTVASLTRRFPSPAAAEASVPLPSPLAPDPAASTGARRESSKPFWSSPWLWGALGGAALIGGAIFIASRDTSDQPIHVRVELPR